ncbi:hypothetical protein ABEM04_23955 [Escherichia coli]|nr:MULTISPECIES: hypothetical protein [Enterobacterales]MCS0905883.1 hypothetical protein [Escherichia coli]MCU8698242.1 hypothetical protein [Enterobacter cloacae]MDS0032231.1 hypothetical protein [Enterobacter cloacae subsp. cloacae]UVV98982.1 hypothetical protein NYE91_28030 [Citrobacter freundii]
MIKLANSNLKIKTMARENKIMQLNFLKKPMINELLRNGRISSIAALL